MASIARALRRRHGLDLGHYKEPYARRRALLRARTLGMTDLEQHARHLERHPSEAGEPRYCLSLKVTHFFRNPSFSTHLQQELLPCLLEPGRPIRIWSAGCATGEEAYSIAVLLASLGGNGIGWILATDIDPAGIDTARRAE